eukprot:scaffold62927_cov32-Tisochrysis_lutea.AAC.6
MVPHPPGRRPDKRCWNRQMRVEGFTRSPAAWARAAPLFLSAKPHPDPTCRLPPRQPAAQASVVEEEAATAASTATGAASLFGPA